MSNYTSLSEPSSERIDPIIEAERNRLAEVEWTEVFMARANWYAKRRAAAAEAALQLVRQQEDAQRQREMAAQVNRMAGVAEPQQTDDMPEESDKDVAKTIDIDEVRAWIKEIPPTGGMAA